ncbi:trihelix transcription factor ENAP1-like [Salvia miltiorrhiza]|uniref:trihelix transcription factor ENAP1-like n=1 Tax=Salvia miltiorrhiza TaxID=226208 RepID=UPI0025ACFF5A|nr:trihelix transcription factor ENAP1-like [Salvia miltiorrhiza]XP_057773017.1 trihelix transcription factor ENAP1-like [Salvia miltiorrhiza]
MSDEDDNMCLINGGKFPNQDISYPQNVGKSYIDVEDDEDDDDGGDGVERIGKDDYGGGDEDETTDDDESGDLQRHPKKRKLKTTLLSSYEFAPRLPASSPGSAPVPKPSYGGRNPLLDWTERETSVLLDAWGERYLKRGRKSLRSEEWQEVSEKVSQGSQIERTDTQCRNRLDTLKKKYKKEKVKLGEGGSVACKWIYFNKMDTLLSTPPQQAGGLSCGMESGEYVFTNPKVYLNQSNGLDEMRDSPGNSESGGDGEDESEGLPPQRATNSLFKMLADSIHKFSEIYQKIELSKRQQMVELEKMRMDFHRDLDLQKRQILERGIEKIWQGDDAENGASPENVSG